MCERCNDRGFRQQTVIKNGHSDLVPYPCPCQEESKMKHIAKVIALSLLVAAASVVVVAATIALGCILAAGFVALMTWCGWLGIAIVVGIIVFCVAAFQIEMNLRNGYEWDHIR